jgi:hypothetical protein
MHAINTRINGEGVTVSDGRINVVAFGPKLEKKKVAPYTKISSLGASFPHCRASTE